MAGIENRSVNSYSPDTHIAPESDRIQSNCGLFAIMNVSNFPGGFDLKAMTLLAGASLQHRAEGGAGYAVFDGKGKGQIIKGLGRIDVAFQDGRLLPETPDARIAILHTSYPTAGRPDHLPNKHPLNYERITLAHHGNLTNAQELLNEMPDMEMGGEFPDNDSWIALNLISRSEGETLEQKMINAQKKIEGGYAFIATDGKGLVASRDPEGIRPLFLGRIGPEDDPQAYLLSVETSAFNSLGMSEDNWREVLPGETISIRGREATTVDFSPAAAQRSCIFEIVYMMHPDSKYMGKQIYMSRRKAGHLLWQEQPIDVDDNDQVLVMPVPDSGRASAIGYWKEARKTLGDRVDWDEGVLINRYIGRNFIKSKGRRSPGSKFFEIEELVRGKKIVLVDDSLVRGETMARVVEMLRFAGAREVHERNASPEIRRPCHWGVAIPTYEELSAHNIPDIIERAKAIGLDSLGHLSLDGLFDACDADQETRDKFCAYCFGGNGPKMKNGENPDSIPLRETVPVDLISGKF